MKPWMDAPCLPVISSSVSIIGPMYTLIITDAQV